MDITDLHAAARSQFTSKVLFAHSNFTKGNPPTQLANFHIYVLYTIPELDA